MRPFISDSIASCRASCGDCRGRLECRGRFGLRAASRRSGGTGKTSSGLAVFVCSPLECGTLAVVDRGALWFEHAVGVLRNLVVRTRLVQVEPIDYWLRAQLLGVVRGPGSECGALLPFFFAPLKIW